MSASMAIRTCFHKFMIFDGRARRAEFWWFWFFAGVALAASHWVSNAAITAIGQRSSSSVLQFVTYGAVAVQMTVYVMLLVPLFSVSIRRMHDVGRPGWWMLVPAVNIKLGAQDSDYGRNQYGANPKQELNYNRPEEFGTQDQPEIWDVHGRRQRRQSLGIERRWNQAVRMLQRIWRATRGLPPLPSAQEQAAARKRTSGTVLPVSTAKSSWGNRQKTSAGKRKTSTGGRISTLPSASLGTRVDEQGNVQPAPAVKVPAGSGEEQRSASMAQAVKQHWSAAGAVAAATPAVPAAAEVVEGAATSGGVGGQPAANSLSAAAESYRPEVSQQVPATSPMAASTPMVGAMPAAPAPVMPPNQGQPVMPSRDFPFPAGNAPQPYQLSAPGGPQLSREDSHDAGMPLPAMPPAGIPAMPLEAGTQVPPPSVPRPVSPGSLPMPVPGTVIPPGQPIGQPYGQPGLRPIPAMPPGVMPPGVMPSGAMPPGAMPAGGQMPGAFPPRPWPYPPPGVGGAAAPQMMPAAAAGYAPVHGSGMMPRTMPPAPGPGMPPGAMPPVTGPQQLPPQPQPGQSAASSGGAPPAGMSPGAVPPSVPSPPAGGYPQAPAAAHPPATSANQAPPAGPPATGAAAQAPVPATGMPVAAVPAPRAPVQPGAFQQPVPSQPSYAAAAAPQLQPVGASATQPPAPASAAVSAPAATASPEASPPGELADYDYPATAFPTPRKKK